MLFRSRRRQALRLPAQTARDQRPQGRKGPQGPKGRSGRAQALRGAGRQDAAIEDYTAALELNRTDTQVLYGRALAYAVTGQLDRAIRDLLEVTRLEPGNARAWQRLGITDVLLALPSATPQRRRAILETLRGLLFQRTLEAVAES